MDSSLSFAAVLRREFVACCAAFSTVLSAVRVLHGVVFKAAIYLRCGDLKAFYVERGVRNCLGTVRSLC